MLTATIAGGDPVSLKGATALHFGMVLQYRLVQDSARRDWVVQLAAYEYKVLIDVPVSRVQIVQRSEAEDVRTSQCQWRHWLLGAVRIHHVQVVSAASGNRVAMIARSPASCSAVRNGAAL